MADSLGDRMKDFEGVPRVRLMPKVPVAARLDGKAFHTFTRHLERPYDLRFHRCMWAAATYLCEQLGGCTGAYVQSDEITLILLDDRTLNTQAWFGYDLQKMCSVAASICTGAFMSAWMEHFGAVPPMLPAFDARFWNLPKHEIPNLLIWRQNDATRNSLSALAQAHFPPKELHGKSSAERHDLLHGIGLNWNDLPIPQKRGVCVVKERFEREGAARSRWVVDEAIPIFSHEDGRAYLARFAEPPIDEPSDAGEANEG